MLPNTHLQRDCILETLSQLYLVLALSSDKCNTQEYRFSFPKIKPFNVVHGETQVMLLNHILPNYLFCMKGKQYGLYKIVHSIQEQITEK